MAFHPKNYISHWKQFSKYIRFTRAKGVCECKGICGTDHDGRCTAQNNKLGKMGLDGIWRTETQIHNLNSDSGFYLYPDFDRATKVTLTVAHLDHKKGVCRCKEKYGFKCGKPNHVLALCNGCHLRLDNASHVKKRLKNLGKKKDSERKLFEYLDL